MCFEITLTGTDNNFETQLHSLFIKTVFICKYVKQHLILATQGIYLLFNKNLSAAHIFLKSRFNQYEMNLKGN
jgi:hypothetical protein